MFKFCFFKIKTFKSVLLLYFIYVLFFVYLK